MLLFNTTSFTSSVPLVTAVTKVSIVQTAFARVNGTEATLAFPNPPTVGNVMLAMLTGSSGNQSVLAPPTGWDRAFGYDQGNTYNEGVWAYTKTAAADDTGTIVFQSSDTLDLSMFELSGAQDPSTWTWSDGGQGGGTPAPTSAATTSTYTVPPGSDLSIGMVENDDTNPLLSLSVGTIDYNWAGVDSNNHQAAAFHFNSGEGANFTATWSAIPYQWVWFVASTVAS